MFAASAHAQDIITVKVPFAFVVGHESFPAGRYDVAPVDFGSSVMSIRGMDKSGTVGFVLTSLAGGRDPMGDQPALVFTKFENTYRLSQIWESDGEGRVLPQFKAEAKTARVEPSERSTVVVAANVE
jgi:hypothetical protein